MFHGHTSAGLGFDLQDSTDLSLLHRLNSGMSQSSGISLPLEQQANSKVPHLLKSLPAYTHSSTLPCLSLPQAADTNLVPRGFRLPTPLGATKKPTRPWGQDCHVKLCHRTFTSHTSVWSDT